MTPPDAILARIDATLAACDEYNPAAEWVDANMPDVHLTDWQRDIMRRLFRTDSNGFVIFDEMWPRRRGR